MHYNLKQIAEITNGQLHGNGQLVVEDVLYDTRQQFDGERALFVALITNTNNGHKFIDKAIAKGCKALLISEDAKVAANVSYVKVPDTLLALQMLAAAYRNSFNFPVVAITGSLGKTTVKEWFYQAVAPRKQVFKSPKSYNSQLGVALSVLMAKDGFEIGVFEAGISKPNEMGALLQILKPNIGLITNIGEAHQANFKSYDEKLNEKLKLFEHAETVLYHADDFQIAEAIVLKLSHKKLLTWGQNPSATLQVLSRKVEKVVLQYKEQNFELNLHGNDAYHFENVMHCMLLGLALNLDLKAMALQLSDLKPLPMRLEMKQGQYGTLLVNDSYSADFHSLEVALDYLYKVAGNQSKTLVLSEFDEQNVSKEVYKTKLKQLCKRYQINKLVLIGEKLKGVDFSEAKVLHHANTNTLLKELEPLHFKDEAVLIKGARRFRLERLIYLFQAKSHRTRLEINLSALRNNYNYIKAINGEDVRIMVMLKALGYGAGTYELARLLESLKAHYVAVAYIDEGVSLRKKGISLPIMVLSPEPEGFVNLKKFSLEPEIYSFTILKELIDYLKYEALTEPVLIHINLDTGMKRLGFNVEEIPELIALLKENEAIVKVASVFTHLVASDNAAHDAFTLEQLRIYQSGVQLFKKALSYSFICHAANTGGALRHKNAAFDMLRLGIGFYGIDPTKSSKSNLQFAFKWLTQIGQIHTVALGESVGYSRAWIAQRNSKIATLPVGYADGLDRRLSNGNGCVYINGSKAKIVGSVCMDMTMVDITDINANEGDGVVIFENEEQINALCNALQTIPYELMAGISERVKRVYLEE